MNPASCTRSQRHGEAGAPKLRSLGKSAAEGANDGLQEDLVDFGQNTRSNNSLVVTDVFRREVATKVLPDKRSSFHYQLATGPREVSRALHMSYVAVFTTRDPKEPMDSEP